jgi:hypothetical protein
LTWARTENNGSVGVTVNGVAGPQTGATVVVRFRDPDSADLWLDHSDGAWKANAAVVTLDLALPEVDAVDAPGRYEANLDFAATTGYPAASDRIEAIYVVLAPAGFPVDVDTIELVTSVGGDWTSAERAQIRFRLAMDGAQTDPTTGVGTIEDILADTNSLDTTKLTTARADNLDDLDAPISSRAQPGDAMALTAAAVDAVWDEPVAGHQTAGTAGRNITSIAAEATATAGSTATEIRTGLTQADDFYNNMQVVIVGAAGTVVRNIDDYSNVNGAITVSALPFTPSVGDPVIILRRTGSVPVDASSISTAVWSEALPGAFGANTAGERVATIDDTVGVNLDAAVSTRAVPGDEMDLVAGAVDAAAIATNAIDADALAADAVAEIQSGLATSASVAAVQADTDDIQTRLPASLNAGRMRSHVEALDAGTITAAVIAADAVDASALAADAVTEIQSGLATLANQTTILAGLVAINADTDDIQTRLPASLNAGRMRAHVEAIDTTVSDLIAAAVRDVNLTGSPASSLGEGVLISRNEKLFFRLDNFVRNPTTGFATSARLRIFPDSATAAASTQGGIGLQGALVSTTVTGLADGTFAVLPQDVRGA